MSAVSTPVVAALVGCTFVKLSRLKRGRHAIPPTEPLTYKPKRDEIHIHICLSNFSASKT
jgi:hypothetical protein